MINLPGHGKIERVSALRSPRVPAKQMQIHYLEFTEVTIATSAHVVVSLCVCKREIKLPMCCDKLRYLVSNLSFSAHEHCAELVLFSAKCKYTDVYNFFHIGKYILRQYFKLLTCSPTTLRTGTRLT